MHALICRQSKFIGEKETLAEIIQPPTGTSHPLSTQFFLTPNLFLFRCSLLSFINYTCTDASPSCDTNLTLDVVFIFKDGSTFAKVHAQVRGDANSRSKAALSEN